MECAERAPLSDQLHGNPGPVCGPNLTRTYGIGRGITCLPRWDSHANSIPRSPSRPSRKLHPGCGVTRAPFARRRLTPADARRGLWRVASSSCSVATAPRWLLMMAISRSTYLRSSATISLTLFMGLPLHSTGGAFRSYLFLRPDSPIRLRSDLTAQFLCRRHPVLRNRVRIKWRSFTIVRCYLDNIFNRDTTGCVQVRALNAH
jgi:hypothetical protein